MISGCQRICNNIGATQRGLGNLGNGFVRGATSEFKYILYITIVMMCRGKLSMLHLIFQVSVNLVSQQGLQVPRKLAIVMGREADGVTEEMLLAAQR